MAHWKVMLADTGCTAKNSMSLLRQPGPLSTSVRGESTNYPFLPGKLMLRTLMLDVFVPIKVVPLAFGPMILLPWRYTQTLIRYCKTKPNIFYCTVLRCFVWCCLGGMEARETTKPDIVFDGEPNFEKGMSLYL